LVKHKEKYSKIIIEKNRINLELLKFEIKLKKIIKIIYKKLSNNGKILLCGNGGSAADAQHLAAEFLIRLRPNINRHPIPAISLAIDTSTLTACGNDYDFKYIFSRNLDALGNKGKDVLIAISTSGNSQNIIEALKIARKNKIISIGLFGKTGGKAMKYCDIPINIPSDNTARIQESHIFIGHYIFERVEDLILQKRLYIKVK
jgi:D-sedoheptulose 7-phosphate isomerase